MIRLFTALEIPVQAREKLFDIRLSVVDDITFRWESIDKIHLTLKFIGEVDEQYLKPIADSISFLNNFEKIKGEITGFGFFYRKNIPSILNAELKLDEHVQDIVNRLNKSLINFGVEPEKRKFKPHLTLLRLKKHPGEDFINKFNNYSFEPVKFSSDTIKLFQSKLDKSGSQYSEIKTYHLN